MHNFPELVYGPHNMEWRDCVSENRPKKEQPARCGSTSSKKRERAKRSDARSGTNKYKFKMQRHNENRIARRELHERVSENWDTWENVPDELLPYWPCEAMYAGGGGENTVKQCMQAEAVKHEMPAEIVKQDMPTHTVKQEMPMETVKQEMPMETV